MKNITLSELKKLQQITSLDDCFNMDLSHEEDYNKFKDIFPKSVKAIEKLPTDKVYVNTEDPQGEELAFYRYGSLRAWSYWALREISTSTDEYDEESDDGHEYVTNIYRLFDGFKEDAIIDTINECWQLELAELEV